MGAFTIVQWSQRVCHQHVRGAPEIWDISKQRVGSRLETAGIVHNRSVILALTNNILSHQEHDYRRFDTIVFVMNQNIERGEHCQTIILPFSLSLSPVSPCLLLSVSLSLAQQQWTRAIRERWNSPTPWHKVSKFCRQRVNKIAGKISFQVGCHEYLAEPKRSKSRNLRIVASIFTPENIKPNWYETFMRRMRMARPQ